MGASYVSAAWVPSVDLVKPNWRSLSEKIRKAGVVPAGMEDRIPRGVAAAQEADAKVQKFEASLGNLVSQTQSRNKMAKWVKSEPGDPRTPGPT